MSEIYWISRLDYINSLFIALSVIFGSITVVGFFTHLMCEDGDKGTDKLVLKRFYQRALLFFIPSILTVVFIPTSKEAYMIWGVGGTIDYIKSNETIQKLPDKTVQCLDKFIDEYLQEEPTNN